MLYSPISNLYFVQKNETIQNSNFENKRERFIVEYRQTAHHNTFRGSFKTLLLVHINTYNLYVHDTDRILNQFRSYVFVGVAQNGKLSTQFINPLKQYFGLFLTDMSWFYPKWWTCKCALLACCVNHYCTLVKYNINCWLFLSESHPSYQLWRFQTFNTSS